MANSFFNKIIYSACNEDSDSERKALQLTQQDTVLCITGSGARALDLLVDNPKKIISIDFNPHQNHLLHLKIAAYQMLSYDEFKSLVGLDTVFERRTLYAKLQSKLLPEVRLYWGKHFKMIENGLLYCGTWEKLQRGMIRAVFMRRKKIKQLMLSDSLQSQKVFWDQKWNNTSWQFFLKILGNRFLWTKVIREPGALLIPKEFDVYQYMNERLDYLAHHHWLKSNHFAHLMFYGEYKKECILPSHLREENFDYLKEKVAGIEIKTISLLDAVKDIEITKQVTAYSLSDFSSYCPLDLYNEIWTKLSANALAGSKVCERHFLVKRENPVSVNIFHRNFNLEERLKKEDITAIYSFCVGEFVK